MTIRCTLLALAFAGASLGFVPPAHAQSAEPDPVVEVSAADAAMNAAKAEAQATLPEWLSVLANPPAGTRDIGFKFPLEGWEHIWVENVTRDGDFLQGTLGNTPHSEGWNWGDFVRVPLTSVSDWAYRDANGVMQGHRTTRVLFDQLPTEVARDIRRGFGWE